MTAGDLYPVEYLSVVSSLPGSRVFDKPSAGDPASSVSLPLAWVVSAHFCGMAARLAPFPPQSRPTNRPNLSITLRQKAKKMEQSHATPQAKTRHGSDTQQGTSSPCPLFGLGQYLISSRPRRNARDQHQPCLRHRRSTRDHHPDQRPRTVRDIGACRDHHRPRHAPSWRQWRHCRQFDRKQWVGIARLQAKIICARGRTTSATPMETEMKGGLTARSISPSGRGHPTEYSAAHFPRLVVDQPTNSSPAKK